VLDVPCTTRMSSRAGVRIRKYIYLINEIFKTPLPALHPCLMPLLGDDGGMNPLKNRDCIETFLVW